MALKLNDLRNMTKGELDLKLTSLKVELFNFRFQAETGRIEKPHNIKIIKRDIARIKTVLREGELKDAGVSRKA